jgi:cytochrome P450
MHRKSSTTLGKWTYQNVKVSPWIFKARRVSILDRELTEVVDWEEVDIQHVLRWIIGRISARTFIGYPACRNDAWVQMSFDYARDIFGLTFITHCFPKILHPFVFLLAPARWRLGGYSKKAHEVLAPAVKQWEDAKAVGALEGEPFTLLGGMLKDAKGPERNMEEIVLRQMIASLASIHTSVMTETYCLMELCRNPEYIEPLLEEARDCMSKDQDWARHSTERLPMMDSFICEVHRLHPPSVRKHSSSSYPFMRVS